MRVWMTAAISSCGDKEDVGSLDFTPFAAAGIQRKLCFQSQVRWKLIRLFLKQVCVCFWITTAAFRNATFSRVASCFSLSLF